MLPAPAHQIVSYELQALLVPLVKPRGASAMATVAIRVIDEDGPETWIDVALAPATLVEN